MEQRGTFAQEDAGMSQSGQGFYGGTPMTHTDGHFASVLLGVKGHGSKTRGVERGGRVSLPVTHAQ